MWKQLTQWLRNSFDRMWFGSHFWVIRSSLSVIAVTVAIEPAAAEWNGNIKSLVGELIYLKLKTESENLHGLRMGFDGTCSFEWHSMTWAVLNICKNSNLTQIIYKTQPKRLMAYVLRQKCLGDSGNQCDAQWVYLNLNRKSQRICWRKLLSVASRDRFYFAASFCCWQPNLPDCFAM